VVHRWKIGIAAALVLIGLAVWLWPRGYCRSAKRAYGLELPQCPDGTLRQTLTIQGDGLRRNGPGTVRLGATALYTVRQADEWTSAAIPRFDAELELVDALGEATPIRPTGEEGKGWERYGDRRGATIVLPEVPDGDYLLRATIRSRVGTDTIDLPLGLYAPAKVHVISDRPLYEPGHVVKFRALALRAGDLAPIEHRPGVWVVRDPSGQVLLEEKAAADSWGVVAGDFPLDAEATPGEWSVSWRSGDGEGSRTFRVAPFSLPRFRVEAAAGRPFYRPGEGPRLAGAVTYSSGAPVVGAALAIDWAVNADAGWPPPTAWTEGALPDRAVSDESGRFELRLPEVPGDLQGQARLVARIAATDPAGDRVVGGATVLLSEEAISVQAITELAGGLVEGFNNRVYLRVTTADGRPLPGARIAVERAWSAAEPAIEAVLDEDAVARIQLDPGPPVNVVVPPRPVRPPPTPPAVTRVHAQELVSRQPPSLADQVAIDRWEAELHGCARWVSGSPVEVPVALQIAESGAVVAGDAADSELGRCVLAAVRTARLPAGPPRLLSLRYRLDGSSLPSVTASVEAPLGAAGGVGTLFTEAALDARACVPRDLHGPVPWSMAWQVEPGSRAVRVDWNRTGAQVSPALAACLLERVRRRQLAEPAAARRLGLVRFAVGRVGGGEPAVARPTIMQGYELRVSAAVDGATVGAATLRMAPGTVPPLRLRATPVLAAAGEPVRVELLRGPNFSGDLPKEVLVDHVGTVTRAEVGEDRSATFTVPADARGWFEVRAGAARSLVYVRSGEELAVSVEPDRSAYAPGDDVTLGVRTELGGRGAQAAVTLIGVDESLGQLAPLPGPEDLAGVRPEVPMVEPAFGLLDGQALALGRIRGAAAAEATVLRVASVPTPAELDVVVSGRAESELDPLAELIDRFYPILEELHAQARRWEREAAAGELMTPETMAALWSRALDAAAAHGVATEDAFGRRLRLHRLPPDLLALTDPRQVVVVGTRLPEDVENWSAWVARRKP
jgi:hypothetical protein